MIGHIKDDFHNQKTELPSWLSDTVIRYGEIHSEHQVPFDNGPVTRPQMPRSFSLFTACNLSLINLMQCLWVTILPSQLANTLIVAHYLPDTILDALLSFHLHSPGPGGHRYKDRSCDLWLTEPVVKLTDDRDISSNSLGCLDIIFWGHRHT